MNQNLITALFNVHVYDQVDTLYMYILMGQYLPSPMPVGILYPVEKLFLCFVFTFCPVKFQILTDLVHVSPPGYQMILFLY